MAVVLALTVAFAIAALLAPPVGALARRLNVVDHPGALKVQQSAVPYLGGIAVFAATASVVGGARPALLVPLAMGLVVGTVDDWRGLSPRVRLGLEVAVAAVAAQVVPTGLAGPLGPLATAVAVVVLINAFNLIDGLDGLAGGVGLFSALGFACLLSGDIRVLALGLAGGLAGFLVHNRPPARIYLGDGGAYLVGVSVALLLAGAWSDGRTFAVGISSLALVAVPVAETGVAIIRRRRAHRPLFEGDRGHVYDQLVDRGWSPARTVAASCALQAALAGAALVASTFQPVPAAVALVVVAFLLLVAAHVGGFLRPSYGGAHGSAPIGTGCDPQTAASHVPDGQPGLESDARSDADLGDGPG